MSQLSIHTASPPCQPKIRSTRRVRGIASYIDQHTEREKGADNPFLAQRIPLKAALSVRPHARLSCWSATRHTIPGSTDHRNTANNRQISQTTHSPNTRPTKHKNLDHGVYGFSGRNTIRQLKREGKVYNKRGTLCTRLQIPRWTMYGERG